MAAFPLSHYVYPHFKTPISYLSASFESNVKKTYALECYIS